MRAEQEPDPRGRVWVDLFRADSKSSRSPPNWKSLVRQSSREETEFMNSGTVMKHVRLIRKGDNYLQEAKWVEGERPNWK